MRGSLRAKASHNSALLWPKLAELQGLAVMGIGVWACVKSVTVHVGTRPYQILRHGDSLIGLSGGLANQRSQRMMPDGRLLQSVKSHRDRREADEKPDRPIHIRCVML